MGYTQPASGGSVIEVVRPVEPPCTTVSYSPLANHVLMAECARRADPKRRSYRQIVRDEILTPLKMNDTSVGLRADPRPRKVVPDFRGNYPIGHRRGRHHADYVDTDRCGGAA